MRAVRGGLPGQGTGTAGPESHQPRAAATATGRRPGGDRVLRDDPGQRPVPGRLRYRARRAVPPAAVRVLRRLYRMRRDSVPEAAVPAVRRPADDRQRDRLFLDLRREPAHDAVDDRRARSRAGLVQLAVRGQRRVRARLPARRRSAPAAGPQPARRTARRRGCRPRRRDPRRAAAPRVGVRRATRPGRRTPAPAGRPRPGPPRGRGPDHRAGPPRTAQRVDRRRGRLGV